MLVQFPGTMQDAGGRKVVSYRNLARALRSLNGFYHPHPLLHSILGNHVHVKEYISIGKHVSIDPFNDVDCRWPVMLCISSGSCVASMVWIEYCTHANASLLGLQIGAHGKNSVPIPATC